MSLVERMRERMGRGSVATTDTPKVRYFIEIEVMVDDTGDEYENEDRFDDVLGQIADAAQVLSGDGIIAYVSDHGRDP